MKNDNHKDKWYFFSGVLTLTPNQSNLATPDGKQLLPQTQIINGVTHADEDDLFDPTKVLDDIKVTTSIPCTIHFLVQNFFVISRFQAEKIRNKNTNKEKEILPTIPKRF